MSGSEKPIEVKSATAPQPVNVFYSYAHEDEAFRVELEKHLSLMRRNGEIAGWHDRNISAGAEWKRSIDEHLESARLILLLVSADFIASDYCYDIEMRRAIERHEAGEACVIPIILRPCDWHSAPFGRLQALPKNAKPITGWEDRDDAFLNAAQGIRNVVKELTTPLASPLAIHVGTMGREQVQSLNPVTSHSSEGASGQGQAGKQTEPSNERSGPFASSQETITVRDNMRAKLSKIHPTIWVAIIAGMVAIITAYWQYKPDHSGASATDRTAQYAGRVIDAKNQQVIKGAKVSVETQGIPQVYYTDDDGVFYLKLHGSHDGVRIRVEANNYQVFDRHVSISRTGIEDVRLNPSSTPTPSPTLSVVPNVNAPVSRTRVGTPQPRNARQPIPCTPERKAQGLC